MYRFFPVGKLSEDLVVTVFLYMFARVLYGLLRRDVLDQSGHNFSVGGIDSRVFQRSQIDLGRSFGCVSHPGADDRERDVVFSCGRGPTVSGGVGREGFFQIQPEG